MSTATQYNPQPALNERLLAAGASKTVYALVTSEVETIKRDMLVGNEPGLSDDYLDMFREAWTGKQDQYHERFFKTWHEWSRPVVDLNRKNFPSYYPCNGASEPIRQLVYDLVAASSASGLFPANIHVFEGEYEGYKAMAEAAGANLIENKRENWRVLAGLLTHTPNKGDLFFISAPSAIDGMVWQDFNAFLEAMPPNSVVVDCTYVGAIPKSSLKKRFNLNVPSVSSVVFSLSKPFGCYYDRIGGIFCREENPALFGNKWFKNLTSLALGTRLMESFDVFHMPSKYARFQNRAARRTATELALAIEPADVYILGRGVNEANSELETYLLRASKVRVCLTPGIAEEIKEMNDRQTLVNRLEESPGADPELGQAVLVILTSYTLESGLPTAQEDPTGNLQAASKLFPQGSYPQISKIGTDTWRVHLGFGSKRGGIVTTAQTAALAVCGACVKASLPHDAEV